MKRKRRDFIKHLGKMGGVGLLANYPLISSANSPARKKVNNLGPEETAFKISILQTTDSHCQVHPHDEFFWEDEKPVFRKTGGYAHLATYLQNERKNNPHTFIIDTGDMFQGSELAVKTMGKVMIPILNGLGYDLYLPGNWEVVYGKKNMQTLLGSLNSPKVCANMYHDLGEGKKGELIFPPYYVWHVKNVKIGFLGYTDPLVPIRQSPDYSKGITYSKPEENLAYYVDVLRSQEQCDYVIILSHLGLSQQIYLSNREECNGVDYILGGDTHERVRKPIQGKYSKVVEPGAFGSFVGKLNLTIQNGKVIKDEYELVEISSEKHKPSRRIADIIKANEEPFTDEINKIEGYSTIPLYRYFVIENTIDTLILDALKWKLKDIDIVLSNGFRFCPPAVTPDHTGNIPITNGYIFDMFPVDSVVRTAEVTGRQLRDWLEKELNNVFAKDASQRMGGWVIKFKGMKMKFKAYDEEGSRVKYISVNNEEINESKIYSISACEREGDPENTLCRIDGVSNARNTDYDMHQVIKEYLNANSPVTPALPLSARVLDAPQTLLTQVYDVDYQFR
ncbi:MAG: bifunctional metallophosphatase/5'-nucleotidase [Cyclobacteriaceae bacterium]|nr:bifunctional metallophosphatase/5'-nucleotidase [Cyclobacteriaceae bacterium]MDH4298071.1 bifunctional metallophosphatase/5'-nucleotidase [Cyclobacteriaceae bacterium]MDH5250016.1 bifunctional metallophosphatase/5'-nucleotidase [Cyclobacteriaceae bacterium]